MASAENKVTTNQAPTKQKETGTGIVKAVTSGDTFIVLQMTKSNSGPPPEREIVLSSITAPRMRRNEKDESFAFASREFLRKKIIGQKVNFEVEYRAETGRTYANVTLANTGENLGKLLASEGMVFVREPPQGKEARNEYHAELIALSQQASEAKKGIYTDNEKLKELSIRPVYDKVNYVQLFDKLKNHTVDAVVEWVRDGATMRLSLAQTHHNILVRLAGVATPKIPRDDKEQPEPFAREAKFFTEKCLLHRDVQLTIKGIGKNDDFSGIVEMAGRDLGEELLKAGLAKYVNWSCPAEKADRYSSIEKNAKAQRLRLWSKFSPAPDDSNAINAEEFTGKVREILLSFAIVVEDAVKQTHQLMLSSINIPRQGGPNRESEPWSWEAREFLRSKLVGNKVSCKKDYVKPASTTPDGREVPARSYWTIIIDKTNVALMLVERGLAKVLSHRDESRSQQYELLLTAERKAEQKKKGVWGNQLPPPHRFNDLTLKTNDRAKKSKGMLSFLQRAGRTTAVVEFVFGGSRFKVFIPKESCMVMLSLEGIRTPMKGSPYADEATDFAKRKLLQRDVDIVVDSVDKNGTFIGNLYHKRNNQNFALVLLQRGLASVYGDRGANAAEFAHTEKAAKEARKKIWENYDEAEEARKREERIAERLAEQTKDVFQIKVSEIVHGGWFYIQRFDQVEALEKLMEGINRSEPPPAPIGFANTLKRRDLVLCRFPEDNRWYRAQVDAVQDGIARVVYVDYGNCEEVKVGDLRVLDHDLAIIHPFAQECTLAFARVPPPSEDFGEEAALALRDLIWDRTLACSIEYSEGDRQHVTIVNPESNTLINAALVAQGLAIVPRRPLGFNQKVVAEMREAQETARRERKMMWMYGDVDDEE